MRSLASSGDERAGTAISAAANLGRYAGDERLAAIFKQMRDIVGVSQSEMARRLHTTVSTLLDFEAGAVAALPEWPETVRIVDRYAELSQVDASPILSRLLQLQAVPVDAAAPRPIVPARAARPQATQALPEYAAPTPAARIPVAIETARQRIAAAPESVGRPIDVATGRHPRPANPANAQPMQPAQPAPVQQATVADDHAVGFNDRSRTRETTVRSGRQPNAVAAVNIDEVVARKRRRRRRTALVVGPFLASAMVFAAMSIAPRPFYRVANVLPTLAASPLLAVLDMAVAQTAAVRDGLRWIELDDPRLRKGDRLSR